MNISEYTYLINKPDGVKERQTAGLEKIVQEFPYFQSARALYLKGLYNQNSFKYNYVLKITAAHTPDRSVLFDFITSESFAGIQNDQFDRQAKEILDISVREIEIVEHRLEPRENTVEHSIRSSIRESGVSDPATPENNNLPQHIDGTGPKGETAVDLAGQPTIDSHENQSEPSAESLELGAPLAFTSAERHSFQEWLQLSRIKPIVREEDEAGAESEQEEKQKKNDLIDRFIEASPKIPQVKHDTPTTAPITFEFNSSDNSYLMTETLARVYLEQRKYHKAIQAYEILILKYPEKSSFFADRISDVRNLQQNNKQ